jgi:hypothetical protein
MFNNKYEIFDKYFAPSNINICDYVLVGGGGRGKPNNKTPPIDTCYLPYFNSNFTRQLNTTLDQPNKLFGFPISRSRWSYRFELYKRNTYK